MSNDRFSGGRGLDSNADYMRIKRRSIASLNSTISRRDINRRILFYGTAAICLTIAGCPVLESIDYNLRRPKIEAIDQFNAHPELRKKYQVINSLGATTRQYPTSSDKDNILPENLRTDDLIEEAIVVIGNNPHYPEGHADAELPSINAPWLFIPTDRNSKGYATDGYFSLKENFKEIP